MFSRNNFIKHVSFTIYKHKLYNYFGNFIITSKSTDATTMEKPANLFDPLKIPTQDVYKILDNAKQFKNSEVEYSNLFSDKNICILTTNRPREATAQLLMWTVPQLMGAKIYPVYKIWSSLKHKKDFGRMISSFYDMMLIESNYCAEVYDISSGANIPVIYVACSLHHPLQGFSHLMTIKEHFGFLEKLTFAWIGPGNATLNTYMELLPKFGIDIKYNCCTHPDLPVSPMGLQKTNELLKITKTKLTECRTAEEAIKGVDIIATTSHGKSYPAISLSLLEEANENWIILHDLPRGEDELTDDAFQHKNNLVWENFKNLVYIGMAVMKYSFENCALQNNTDV